jgi:hypothetical protein
LVGRGISSDKAPTAASLLKVAAAAVVVSAAATAKVLPAGPLGERKAEEEAAIKR